jgi:hypothetical protein
MTVMRKRLLAPALVLGALGLVVMAQVASATHPRPRGATPLRISLVPAFKQCTAPNRTHGAPLASPSCNPPVRASSFLTVGTPDANGAGANSQGFMLVRVKETSPQDVLTTLSISDVRCRPGTDASVCGTANAADGPDYSGQIQGNATLRISDHYNGPNLTEAATVVDIPFPVNAFCVSTSDTSIGSTCSVTACATCIGPPRGDIGGQRSVVEITQIQVFDGGADGNISTQPENNTLFAIQGIFTP